MSDGKVMILLGVFLVVAGVVTIVRREHYAKQPPLYGTVGPVKKSRWWPAPIILGVVLLLVAVVAVLARGGSWPVGLIFIVGPLIGWGYSMRTGKRFMGFAYGRPRVHGALGAMVALMGLAVLVNAIRG